MKNILLKKQFLSMNNVFILFLKIFLFNPKEYNIICKK